MSLLETKIAARIKKNYFTIRGDSKMMLKRNMSFIREETSAPVSHETESKACIERVDSHRRATPSPGTRPTTTRYPRLR